MLRVVCVKVKGELAVIVTVTSEPSDAGVVNGVVIAPDPPGTAVVVVTITRLVVMICVVVVVEIPVTPESTPLVMTGSVPFGGLHCGQQGN